MVFILYKLYVLLPYTYPTPTLSPHRRRCISIFPQKNSLCMIYKHFKLWRHWKCPYKSSRVTCVTLVLWVGNETLRWPLRERLRVTESWTHIESRQFIGWWRDAVSDAMTSSGHTGERAIHSSDFSAEKNPVGSVRSLAANAVSRSLLREQGLRK